MWKSIAMIIYVGDTCFQNGGNTVPRLAAYYAAVDFTTVIAAWREEILALGDKPCKVAGLSYRDAIDHFSIIETVAKVGTDLQVQLLALSMRVCDVKKAEVAAIQRGSDFNSYDEQVPPEAAPALRKFASVLMGLVAHLEENHDLFLSDLLDCSSLQMGPQFFPFLW